MPQYEMRRMRREELDIAIEWAATEGWNPGLHDAGAFFAADPTGFFVGLLDGIPIAAISAVTYDATFAFLGFYIVRRDLRGRGYGLALWQHALSEVHSSNIGLDGVPAQVPNYEKSGFTLANRHIRFAGAGGQRKRPDSNIVPLIDVDFDALSAYDEHLFPAPRPAFLRAWVTLPESTGLAALGNGSIAGYGVIRRCRSGYKVGPLFADGESIAEQLFVALAAEVEPGAAVYLDVPEINAAALSLAERHAMAPVFETARMYTNGQPRIDVDRVFGVTTLELG
jgi:GNAT superfamily N-acetyltransferase